MNAAELRQVIKQVVGQELSATERKFLRHVAGGHDVLPSGPGTVSEQLALSMGYLFKAVSTGQGKFYDKLENDFGFTRAQIESDDAAGGVTVPDELSREIIRLVDSYGVFRRNARPWRMGSAKTIIPTRTTGLTVYAPGEAASITESTARFGKVELEARKWATLTAISSELEEDSLLDVGAYLAEEIALAFAEKEDRCAFLGDGTSTYFGIKGIVPAITTLDGTVANIASVVVGSGNQWSELTLLDHMNVIGRAKLRSWRNAKWYCSPTYWATTMCRLALAQLGATTADALAGTQAFAPRFLGFPVEFVNVMPTLEANSQVPCLFGDVRQGAILGTRRKPMNGIAYGTPPCSFTDPAHATDNGGTACPA